MGHEAYAGTKSQAIINCFKEYLQKKTGKTTIGMLVSNDHIFYYDTIDTLFFINEYRFKKYRAYVRDVRDKDDYIKRVCPVLYKEFSTAHIDIYGCYDEKYLQDRKRVMENDRYLFPRSDQTGEDQL